ncbi:MAG TPA: peptidylprolyl isomerase [Gaiellaceae bacterium]|nr:peptidylprolyl isomerase [Gaiellaceae bacterium]
MRWVPVAALVVVLVLAGCGGSGAKTTPGTTTAAAGADLLHPATLDAKAPATYEARFTTTKGAFVVTVHRAWAPLGADRFYNLVRSGFYDGQRLFRVVPGFVVQWGISGDPKVAKAWQDATIPDDPVQHSNAPGTITFATAGPDTRTTQVFVNFGSNGFLDQQGFAPFGVVTSGGAAISALYSGYGEKPTNAQPQIAAGGEAYLKKTFPKLDRILTARIVG